jgi:hypothetical protein
MENPNRYQQQSLHRKLLYFGLIVGLLTLGWLVRYRSLRVGGTELGIVSQATRLGLRERDVGEADLSGSTLNLTLTGSRGLVLCLLWWDSMDLAEHHEWNQLDLRVRLITKLQPHFIQPWLFQSWNLAYNVSVESDRINDKYYYISRGMDLLAEGVRRNRDNPDLPYNMGRYLIGKFGISDESRTFRCLFQLSCIDPRKWDERRFRQQGRLDPTPAGWVEFEEFCKTHPFLVRRLRQELGYNTPHEIIDFLHDNRKVPSRYEQPLDNSLEGNTPLKPPEAQFPLLPPRPLYYKVSNDTEEIDDGNGEMAKTFEPYALARAWYGFACDPLYMDPPRNPRQPGRVIFLSYPARAQAYRAERMEKEGWFDEGWTIDDWFPKDPTRQRGFGSLKSVQVAERHNWAGEEWDRAHRLYEDYGRRTGLLQDPAAEAKLNGAQRFRLETDRRVTNYARFWAETKFEREPAAVQARKYFYLADRLRRGGASAAQVVAVYENPAAFGPPAQWYKKPRTGFKKLFLTKDFQDYRADTDIQEDVYRLQLRYFDQVRQARGTTLQAAKTACDLVTQFATAPLSGLTLQPRQFTDDRRFATAFATPFQALTLQGPMEYGRSVPWPLRGPFDDVDDSGQPLIEDMVKSTFSFDPRSYMLPKPPMPMMSPDGSLTPRGGAARASPRGNR